LTDRGAPKRTRGTPSLRIETTYAVVYGSSLPPTVALALEPASDHVSDPAVEAASSFSVSHVAISANGR
jgi:hypothetical protein